jgi:glycosyltransferase involved in cell wall biosynthesis
MSDYHGTCLLEDALLVGYQARWPDKQFAYLPDVTETGLPAQPTALATEIKKLAAGRKIVFMGGSIGKQKNIARWLELIQQADSTNWYFVQCGRINKNNLTGEDASAFAVVQSSPPNNLYMHTDYIADELVFNEIISVADFIFAVYKDFFRSSNMLSKAAYFEKPILVANQCLMGDRVKRYGIGLAVPADDTQAIHQGLTALVELPNLSANFSVYRQDFNQDILQKRLICFVEGCLSQAAGATTTLRQSEKCS